MKLLLVTGFKSLFILRKVYDEEHGRQCFTHLNRKCVFSHLYEINGEEVTLVAGFRGTPADFPGGEVKLTEAIVEFCLDPSKF